MGRSLRIVCYAVNGGGVGHLTRLVAIARWMRRYGSYAGYRTEIVFLTSSEAEGILFGERMASFKVPSKTAAHEAGLDKLAYVALAKQWVWHSVALLRPDLLVVDTFPRGSFGELGGCLDLCKKKAFVYRPIKPELAARPDFQSILPFYDLVVVPEERSSLVVPASVAPRLRHVGPVVIRERAELPSRAEARRLLALPDDAFVVFASAGGGGDPGAQADLDAIVQAFADDESVHLVVAAGPLYRGPPYYGPRVRFTTSLGAIEMLPAVDVAIAGAGYNTFSELMLAGVPTVFVPQDKVADEQAARAARAVESGAGTLLARPLQVDSLRTAVNAYRNRDTRERAALVARSLVEGRGARCAAKDLLSLVLPASEIAAASDAMTDAVVGAARGLRVPEASFVDVMHLLDPAPDDMPSLDAGASSLEAVRFVEAVVQRGIPVQQAVRVASSLLRRIQSGTPADRAAACLDVLDALAPFDDWAGAAALLKLAPSVHVEPRALAAEVRALANDLLRRNEDLYRGIARLVRGSPAARAVALQAPSEDVELDPAEGSA